jgi:precorrin-8X/cobalt-precorrin-8 methylmutase
VHDRETVLLAENNGITRSAAGVRRAWQKWGNDIVLAIGDAPTAVAEATRLIREHGWRPQLVIGLPVGFVGTQECKEDLRRCLHVPRITNSGTRGGSPWAASAVNALMIEAIDFLTKK